MKNNNMFNNFRFGPCGNKCGLSHLGIAIINKDGSFVSYDKEKKEIINVDLINFSKKELVYEMPVAIKDIAVGDCIIHMGTPMFVIEIANNKDIIAIDPYAGEKKTILPTKNLFGFDFIQKVVSLVDISNTNASEDNPFGNLFPLMMLSNENSFNLSTFLMFSMMNKDKKDFKLDMSNPMMLYLLMGKENGGSNDIAPFLMMMAMKNQNQD